MRREAVTVYLDILFYKIGMWDCAAFLVLFDLGNHHLNSQIIFICVSQQFDNGIWKVKVSQYSIVISIHSQTFPPVEKRFSLLNLTKPNYLFDPFTPGLNRVTIKIAI